ncbi:zinc-binding alcohol dehydrogenase family protein [Paenibacillus donghaensis]|uniref:Alcohol dehydrogenase n=1 Tax=Paenibacillus donghaensis TaxID=414771 RepID=A0A2Z2KN51_9BACL|nr:zinc-binding alcohol dehydrogenase family protein [Paenibacillus donghaensis]ASA24029.1 alcohol dehydrogenase [Paenibacillus donghaensis]
MKSIVCEQPGQLVLKELEEPVVSEGSALVAIRRIGICGTDLHAYQGKQPFFSYPRILGHELAGTIEQIGGNDQGLKAGDQVSIIPYMHCGSCIACRNDKTNCCTDMQVFGVHIDGGMRERVTVPISHLIQTNGLSLEQSALLEPFSIGRHAVRRSELRAGEVVLVIGAGPIGLGVMVFAKQQGATVIAMDVNVERLAFCKQWAEADYTVHALQEPGAAIAALTGGDYPTVVYDATGNLHSMSSAFEYVGHGGKLVYVGLVREEITFNDPEFHKREMTLMGSRNATLEDFGQVMEAMKDGSLDVGAYITHRVPFTEMISRFDRWLLPEEKVIKAIVEL